MFAYKNNKYEYFQPFDFETIFLTKGSFSLVSLFTKRTQLKVQPKSEAKWPIK